MSQEERRREKNIYTQRRVTKMKSGLMTKCAYSIRIKTPQNKYYISFAQILFKMHSLTSHSYKLLPSASRKNKILISFILPAIYKMPHRTSMGEN